MRGLSPSALSAVAGITALVASFKGLTSSLKVALDNFSHFESMQKGLETFFQSADKGKAKFEELRKLSNQTTFGVDELADSFTQLANVGVNVDKINDRLMMLGDISGGNKVKFAELVQIYAKIQSTGKAGAMQIQQLASRGVPIYDMLKKMGVQGKATGEDITKAFQEMTKEGGQFYGAMNNINDTIEGKEGFISDYFKEMTVNLMDVTGIAQAYKDILDTVREAIGLVSDKLGELNQNPVAKAIISGTTIAVLTSLATIIGVTLVGALKSVNARLRETVILKSILDPKTLGIALLIGGAVGLGVALKNVAKQQKEVAEQAERTSEQFGKQSHYVNKDMLLESAKSSAQKYEEKIKSISLDLQKLESERERLQKEFRTNAQIDMGEYADFQVGIIADEVKNLMGKNGVNENVVQQLKNNADEIERLKKQSEQYTKLLDVENKTIGTIDSLKERGQEYNKLSQSVTDYFDKAYGVDKLDTLKSELKDVNDLIALNDKTMVNDLGEEVIIHFSDKQKREFDLMAEYLKNAIENQTYKISANKQTDWQKLLQKSFGFTDKEVSNGATSSTVGSIDFYKTAVMKQGELMNSLTGKNDQSYIKEMYEGIIKAFESVMQSVREGTYKGTESSLVEFAKEAEKAKNMLNNISLNDINKNYMNELGLNNLLGGGRTGRKNALENYMREIESEMKRLIDGGLSPMDDEVRNLAKQYKELNHSLETMNLSDSIMDSIISATGELGQIFEIVRTMIENKSQGLSSEGGDENAVTNSSGNWIILVIGLVINAIMNVAKEFENFEDVISPVTRWFQNLKGLLQGLFNALEGIGDIINTILIALQPVLDLIGGVLTGIGGFLKMILGILSPLLGLIRLLTSVLNPITDAINEWYKGLSETIDSLLSFFGIQSSVNDEKQKELERLKELNKQYAQLSEAIDEQEQYYLKRKQELNASSYNENINRVNDMILTPKGTFSTHPQDTIIAMQHPEQLVNRSSVVLQPIINDYGGNDVEVRRESDANGMEKLIVNISKKVASDMANGYNGWDNAVAIQQARLKGKGYSR